MLGSILWMPTCLWAPLLLSRCCSPANVLGQWHPAPGPIKFNIPQTEHILPLQNRSVLHIPIFHVARQLLGNLDILSEPFPLNTYCVAGTMLRAKGLIPVKNEPAMVLVLIRHGRVEQEGQKARAAQEQHDGRRGCQRQKGASDGAEGQKRCPRQRCSTCKGLTQRTGTNEGGGGRGSREYRRSNRGMRKSGQGGPDHPGPRKPH